MADMADPTRILIVDDHPFVREGLKQLLAGQSEFVLPGEAASVADARTAIDGSQNPDVAVVDLALGADDGIELVRWIRSRSSRMCACWCCRCRTKRCTPSGCCASASAVM